MSYFLVPVIAPHHRAPSVLGSHRNRFPQFSRCVPRENKSFTKLASLSCPRFLIRGPTSGTERAPKARATAPSNIRFSGVPPGGADCTTRLTLACRGRATVGNPEDIALGKKKNCQRIDMPRMLSTARGLSVPRTCGLRGRPCRPCRLRRACRPRRHRPRRCRSCRKPIG